MNTIEIINYYANLLILQYIGKARAYATIQTVVTPIIMPQVTTQTIVFSPVPTSGAFTLFYGANETASINWNDSALTIQGILQALSGLSAVTVSGSIASGLLTVTFTGVTPPATLLVLGANTLSPVTTPIITEIDVTLPIAVQNAFNITGSNPAQGVQLDVIGKYVGVTRTAQGFTSQITLDDADFRSLIKLATVENNAGSSTAEIVKILNDFFPAEVFLFDRQTMEFDYFISTAVGSQDFIQIVIAESQLPKPMAVRIRLIIYAPVINMFFGFRTYEMPAFNVTPFNDYTTYHLDYPWLSYKNAIII
jgi:hypothetical protein